MSLGRLNPTVSLGGPHGLSDPRSYFSPEGNGMAAVGGTKAGPDLFDASTLLPFESPDGDEGHDDTAYLSFAP